MKTTLAQLIVHQTTRRDIQHIIVNCLSIQRPYHPDDIRTKPFLNFTVGDKTNDHNPLHHPSFHEMNTKSSQTYEIGKQIATLFEKKTNQNNIIAQLT